MKKIIDKLAKLFFFFCASVSVMVIFSIVVILLFKTVGFFLEISPVEFFLTIKWTPLIEPRSFGVLPLICGTFLIAVISGCVSIPVGLLSGIFLSEFANVKTKGVFKPILEILAGIPSIVYGYLAITVFTPFFRFFFPDIYIFNALSAGIVVGIMTLPMVATLCDDVISSVPLSLKEAGYALGATKFEVLTRVVLPASFSGILASFILAFSRAIGETMAVALAAGATPRLTINPLVSIQTITAYIVQVCLGDVPVGSIEYKSIYACGMLLFLITAIINIVSNYILNKYRVRL